MVNNAENATEQTEVDPRRARRHHLEARLRYWLSRDSDLEQHQLAALLGLTVEELRVMACRARIRLPRRESWAI